MNLEETARQIRDRLSAAGHLKNKVKFDFGDDGIVFVDNTGASPVVSHEDAEAEVTLACSLATFEGFMNGSQNPNVAFMMGKLKVKGSMGLAMKLNSILED